MRVTLQKILPTAGSAFDATPFLDESQKQVVTQELEFNSFARTMPDVMLSFSNIGGEFTTLFSGLRMVDLIQVELYDDTGRRRFWGYVDNRTLTFSLRDRYAKFTAFSTMRRFWERAKTTKLYWHPVPFFPATVGLLQFFMYQAFFTDIRGSEGVFSGIDLGEFAAELIRGTDAVNYNNIDNLSRNTTWYDFLIAVSLFHNAEFYIDPESHDLRMVHRVSVMNDRRIDMDGLICDDEDIEVSAIDSHRVDYIKCYAWFTVGAPEMAFKPEQIATLPYGYPQSGLGVGTHYYTTVYHTNGQPTMISDVFAYTLPTPTDGYNWKVSLRIPAHPAGLGQRKVYRSDPADTRGAWYLVSDIAANDANDKVVYDSMNWQFLQRQEERPWVDRRVTAWYSFDESTGVWSQVVDAPKGANTPQGSIFDIIPVLHFMEPADKTVQRTDDPYHVFDFFLQKFSPNDESTRTRWTDFFRTRRLVKCKVTGIDYEVGDSVVSNSGKFPNDLTADKRLVIRKAVCNLMDNTSQLELVTV